jgi:Fe-S-cluster-containing dehydrogenase component
MRFASSASTRARRQGLTTRHRSPGDHALSTRASPALVFGDLDDPQSNVSELLADHQHFRMHEELGTGPGFYYVWDKALP